jgi:hypothetical protein
MLGARHSSTRLRFGGEARLVGRAGSLVPLYGLEVGDCGVQYSLEQVEVLLKDTMIEVVNCMARPS